jgi:hypothetical protein
VPLLKIFLDKSDECKININSTDIVIQYKFLFVLNNFYYITKCKKLLYHKKFRDTAIIKCDEFSKEIKLYNLTRYFKCFNIPTDFFEQLKKNFQIDIDENIDL